jgi:hypothetical protein
MFLRGIDGLAFPDALFILPGYGILGIGPVQSHLVVIENIDLASTFFGINYRCTLGTMSQEKLADEPAAAERP